MVLPSVVRVIVGSEFNHHVRTGRNGIQPNGGGVDAGDSITQSIRRYDQIVIGDRVIILVNPIVNREPGVTGDDEQYLFASSRDEAITDVFHHVDGQLVGFAQEVRRFLVG